MILALVLGLGVDRLLVAQTSGPCSKCCGLTESANGTRGDDACPFNTCWWWRCDGDPECPLNEIECAGTYAL